MTNDSNSDHAVRLNGINSDPFTDRLKVVIKRLGGVANSARMADVAESTVRKWRDGQSEPQRPYLIPLASKAGVSIAWLVAGELPMLHEDQAPGVREDQKKYDASALDTAHLARSLTVVEEFLEEKRLYLQPDKKSLLVTIIYEELDKEEGDIEEGKLLNLVKLAV